MAPLKPWCALDEMKSQRFVLLALLSGAALTTVPTPAWSESSGSRSGESSSSSSSGASSTDWDEFSRPARMCSVRLAPRYTLLVASQWPRPSPAEVAARARNLSPTHAHRPAGQLATRLARRPTRISRPARMCVVRLVPR